MSAGRREWASTKRLAPRKTSSGTLYQPIVDPYEIRVLEIKPGSNDDPIHCSLHHCSLEFKEIPREMIYISETSLLKTRHVATPQNKFGLLMNDLTKPIWYTALSYTWGLPVFDMVIKVDGHEKLVTKSLYGALQHLRQPGHSVVLWIEQICIDQDNKEEKAQQIPLMSTIYTRAINTMVWLGEGDADLAAAFDFVKDVPDLIQHSSAIRCPEDFERLCLPHPDSPTWKGVWDLVSRPWFQRLWIYQEVILSRDIILACGGPQKTKTRMSWDIFSGACLTIQEGGITQWLNLKHSMTRVPEHWLIHPSLRSARQTLCYDARDKIYGLLGLIEIKDNWIKINYHDHYTYPSLYHDVVVGLLKRNMAPLKVILNSIDHEPLGGRCPSWVPDWSKPLETTALGYESSTTNVYNVCGAANPQKHPRYPTGYQILGPNNNELHIEGKVFDTITALSEDFTGMQPCPESFAEIFSLLLDETTGKSPSLPGQTYSPRQLRPLGKGKLTMASLESRQPKRTFEEIRVAMRKALRGRRLVRTERGYMGLVPRCARVGDKVGIIKGCWTPFVLRGEGSVGGGGGFYRGGYEGRGS
ncbi:HET-domain-containing protein [Triangularia verruculosa]|uniref:HET-domain-containing protein n=1 Tax=Triangularia verruculosa TaxID=2587418 RepID=A0AAN6XQZ4_9PEZI|nr:HET-domain-containing protein [Triangularia verruculosa]